MRPKAGGGVIVMKDKKVLLMKRKGVLGVGTWNFPGGHLEFNETVEECARREVREEAGIEITSICRGPWTNDIFRKEKRHYITLFMVAEYQSGEVKIMEPDKCNDWSWFEWGKLPKPLFLPFRNLLKLGFDPFEI